MAEELAQLLRITLNPSVSTEDMNQASETLLQLFEQPTTISLLFEIFAAVTEAPVRTAAATAMKHTVRNTWQESVIGNEEFKEVVKNGFIELLSAEKNTVTRHILLDAMAPVFMTELDQWQDFIRFILSIQADPEYFFSALAACFQYIPFQAVSELFGPIWETIGSVFSQEALNATTVKSGAELLTVMFTFMSADAEVMVPLFEALMACLTNALATPESNVYINDLIKAITSIINVAPPFCNPVDLTNSFIEFLQSETISTDYKILLLDPIEACIGKWPEELAEAFPLCIEQAIQLGTASFEDDCFEQQTGMFMSMQILETLVEIMDPNEFFDEYWAYLSDESPEQVAAFACGLVLFLEHIPNIAALHFRDITNLCVTMMQNEHHCLQEAAISVLMELISRVSDPISEFSEQILTQVIALLADESNHHDNLLKAALSFIVEFLYIVPVSVDNLSPLIEALVALAGTVSEDFSYLIVSAISALIQAAKTEAPNFVEFVSQIILEAAQSEENLLLQSSGIEALSTLIKYAPEKTSEIHEQAIQLFAAACEQEGDISLFTSSIIAITNVVSIKLPAVVPIIGDVLQKAQAIMNIEKTDDTEITHIDSAIAEARSCCCKFIRQLFISMPEACGEIVPALSVITANLIDDESVEKEALKAAVQIAVTTQEIPGYLIGHLMEAFESSSIVSVTNAFHGFEKLIAKGVPTCERAEGEEDGNLAEVIRNAFLWFEGQLLCQSKTNRRQELVGEELEDEDAGIEEQTDDDIDLKDAVFCFFAALAQYRAPEFPLEQFFSTFEELTSDESRIEDQIECIGVFTEYYAVFAENIPHQYKMSIEEAFFTFLKFVVEFQLPPHPVAAVRCLFDITNAASAEQLEAAYELSNAVLEAENEGQLYYWPTVSATVSLLFTIFKLSPTDFDVEKYLPRMLELAPNCLVEAEAENIVSTLVAMNEALQEVIKQNPAIQEAIVAVYRAALDRGVKKGITQATADAAFAILQSLTQE